jgi:hypothetical protein
MVSVTLPASNGKTEILQMLAPRQLDVVPTKPTSRMAYAAAHVVADPLRASMDGRTQHIDWEATMRVRHNLWDLGLGVAESMDTAQRGSGLEWADASSLGMRTLREAKSRGADVVVGVCTDLINWPNASLAEVEAAYKQDLENVQTHGGTAVVMASRHLARAARHADDYVTVYDEVLNQAATPVILHWLGEVFDPALSGYWGSSDIPTAMDTVLSLIERHETEVAGIKVSLLDPAHEVHLRDRLPASVALFTGDDYNYVDMIAGDKKGHSHALLGAFSVLGPFASAALAELDRGDEDRFREILGPTQQLSRLIFEAPTKHYKVGIVWLAYLTGQQSHFRMIGGLESGRDLLHLAGIVREANAIGLFPDPGMAAFRARRYFDAQGL